MPEIKLGKLGGGGGGGYLRVERGKLVWMSCPAHESICCSSILFSIPACFLSYGGNEMRFIPM